MSTDSQLAELNNRVAKLERSGRRWRFAFAALTLIVVGVAADSAVKDATFGTVKARDFQVWNENGKRVARFGVQKEEKSAECGALYIGTEDGQEFTFMLPGDRPVMSGPRK